MKFTCIFIGLLCAFLLPGNSKNIQKEIKGSGNRQTEVREAGDFNAIESSRGLRVILTKGENTSIKVEADDNILPYIKTEIRNNTLRVYLDKEVQVRASKNMDIYVTMPKLTALKGTTSASIESDSPWEVEEVTLTASTSASIRLILQARNIEVKASTSSSIYLKGEVVNFQGNFTTSSDLEAKDLEISNADMTLTTASDAIINVSEELSYTVSTAASLVYMGSPRILRASCSTGASVRNKK